MPSMVQRGRGRRRSFTKSKGRFDVQASLADHQATAAAGTTSVPRAWHLPFCECDRRMRWGTTTPLGRSDRPNAELVQGNEYCTIAFDLVIVLS
jgi:hypothetical protein